LQLSRMMLAASTIIGAKIHDTSTTGSGEKGKASTGKDKRVSSGVGGIVGRGVGKLETN